SEFAVALPHQIERVFVKAEPDVQSVLFDPIVDSFVSSAGPLSAETPTCLVNGDVVTILLRQFVRGSQSADSATKDRDLSPPAFCCRGFLHSRDHQSRRS